MAPSFPSLPSIDLLTATAAVIVGTIALVQLYLARKMPRRERPGARRHPGSSNRGQHSHASASRAKPNYFDLPFHEPSYQDVRLVKAMMQQVKKLPTELVDQILDQAEYWQHSESSVDFGDDHLYISGSRAEEEAKLILRAPPVGFPTGLQTTKNAAYLNQRVEPWRLQKEHPKEYFHNLIAEGPPPTLTHPVRKIVFKIRSKDQGWGGRPEHRATFQGSWTWFEAGLERFDAIQRCDADGVARCELDHPRTSSENETADTAAAVPAEPASKMRSLSINNPVESIINANPLPFCSLRSIYPSTAGNAEGRRWYRSRLDADEEQKIQCNKTAHDAFVDHTVVWSWTDDVDAGSPASEELVNQGRGSASGMGGFVRDMKLGDVVTVWGHARFPGWINKVEKAGVRVYWAI